MQPSLKELLEEKYHQYNTAAFIEDDPIVIPKKFKQLQDIEIAGFIAATLAWGQRPTIISKCNSFISLMDNSPYDFILHHSESDLKVFEKFKHRTFNSTDTLYFIEFFKNHYSKYSSLEDAFLCNLVSEEANIEKGLINFQQYFFSLDSSPQRTRKHVSTPLNNSACKRINMFLRWMVRKDQSGVDFGIWKRIQPSQLICPCDVHVDRIGRKLGLITRKQTDWKTALELTNNLRLYDKDDPVKYDYALFGLGIYEKF